MVDAAAFISIYRREENVHKTSLKGDEILADEVTEEREKRRCSYQSADELKEGKGLSLLKMMGVFRFMNDRESACRRSNDNQRTEK